MIITLQSLGCKVPSALLLLKLCGDIKTKNPILMMKTGSLYLWVIFWEKWVVMDSNHRRHSQQIYSLPHLATLVTTQKLLNCELSLFDKSFVLKSECKGNAFIWYYQIFSAFFSLFLQKMFIFPYKIGFSPLFYPFTFLPFYLYHMSSAVFSRQSSVLVILILLDGNEYREGEDYG